MKQRLFTLLLMVLSGTIAIQAQTIRYVTESGGGTKDGSSWENASKDIQKMMDELETVGGGEVWVKAGVYVPKVKLALVDKNGDPATNRDKTFRLRKDVKLYGGFNGTETALAARDWELNTTVLSGAINEKDSAYHVLVSVGDIGSALLDGFTIMNGRGYISYEQQFPGDYLIGSIPVEGIEVRRRLGTIHIQESSPEMKNLIVTENAGDNSMAIYLNKSGSRISNVVMQNNNTNPLGYYGPKSGAELLNVKFINNTCARFGVLTVEGQGSIGEIKLAGIIIENNVGLGGGGYDDYSGGAIKGLKADIDGLIIRNNHLNGSGTAGLHLESLVDQSTIKNVEITGNTGIMSGYDRSGIYMEACNNISFENIVIKENSSGSSNGIFLVENTNIIFDRLSVSDNYSSIGISGMVVTNSTVSISNSIIRNNEAYCTAGIHLAGSSSNLKGVNILVAENKIFYSTNARSYSNVYIDNIHNKVELINSTIVNNEHKVDNGRWGGNGGVQLNDHTILTNCIIWGNTKGGLPSNYKRLEDATSDGIHQSTLIEDTDIGGLDGTDLSFSPDAMFIDYANGDYRLKQDPSNPVADIGDKTFLEDDGANMTDLDNHSRVSGTNVDLGAYEYQTEALYQIPVFEGGILDNGKRRYTYNGNPIDLKLVNLPAGSSVSYSWAGDENSSGNTVGIVNGGTYTVTATVGSDSYYTDVLVERQYLPISLEGAAMVERIWNITPQPEQTITLAASYDASLYVDGGSFSYEYTLSNTEIASISASILTTGNKAGHSIIRTRTTISGDDLFTRNYELTEAFGLLTVTPLVIDGDVTPTVPSGLTFNEEVIIRNDVTFEGEVKFLQEVTIEGEPTTFNGKVTFKKEVETEGSVEFNNNVIFEQGASFKENPVFNDNAAFAGNIIFENTGGTTILNNDNKIITILDPGAIFNQDIEINGGRLSLGSLVVKADLTLDGVIVDIQPGALIESYNLTVGDLPQSVINLPKLSPNTYDDLLTLTNVTGDPNILFNVTVSDEDPVNHNTTYEWSHNGGDSWTLKGIVTGDNNQPTPPVPPVPNPGTPDPNPDPNSNAEVEDVTRIWSESGQACIQTETPGSVRIVTMTGRLVVSQKVSAGETRISLADGLYIVVLNDGITAKIAIRNF